MKILQLIQTPQLRGAEIFACQLSHWLESQGHTVWVVALFAGEADLPFPVSLRHLDGDPKNRFLDRKGWKRLAEIVSDFQPDIVQANAGDTLKYAGLSRFFFGWKAKLVFRNANLISGFLDSSAKRYFNSLLLGQVDGVASVSELCKEDFRRVFAWRKPIVHLPIAVSPSENVPDLPADLQVLLGADPFLIHIGSFVPEKNHQGLFRIFEKVRESVPNLKLLLCGSGPLFSMICSSLPEGVIALGSRADVREILPFAKALVLPSLIEGLPAVILEAMAAKVPVVAFDTGGISEVLRPGETGSLIPKGEEGLFAERVSEILCAEGKCAEKMAERAVYLVSQTYSLEKVGTRFFEFYSALLEN